MMEIMTILVEMEDRQGEEVLEEEVEEEEIIEEEERTRNENINRKYLIKREGLTSTRTKRMRKKLN
jgi:type II secretory pathway component HofQ